MYRELGKRAALETFGLKHAEYPEMATPNAPKKAKGTPDSTLNKALVLGVTKKADALPGGKADKKNADDFNPHSILKGMKVEREHTSNKSVAKEIASDHLVEDPAYYDKLQKMEKKSFTLHELALYSSLMGGLGGGVAAHMNRAPDETDKGGHPILRGVGSGAAAGLLASALPIGLLKVI